MKIRTLLLLSLGAVPAAAGEFGASVDARAFAEQARDASVVAAPAPGASKTDAYVAASRDWRGAKWDALAALGVLVRHESVDAASWGQWCVLAAKIRTMGVQIEEEQALIRDAARARVLSDASANAADTAARLAVLDDLYSLRVYAVYANVIPRVVDEAITVKGVPSGHLYAGPTWRVAGDFDELKASSRELVGRAGFDVKDFESMEEPILKGYSAQHPLPTSCTP